MKVKIEREPFVSSIEYLSVEDTDHIANVLLKRMNGECFVVTGEKSLTLKDPESALEEMYDLMQRWVKRWVKCTQRGRTETMDDEVEDKFILDEDWE